jgi:hypothetical protein
LWIGSTSWSRSHRRERGRRYEHSTIRRDARTVGPAQARPLRVRPGAIDRSRAPSWTVTIATYWTSMGGSSQVDAACRRIRFAHAQEHQSSSCPGVTRTAPSKCSANRAALALSMFSP